MGIYWKYFKYVCEHKKNVFKECIRLSKKKRFKKYKWSLLFHAFTHDLSKFNPKEFIPYCEWFYGYYGVNLEKKYNYKQLNIRTTDMDYVYLERKKDFEKAWQHHKDKNKHHWNYWWERNLYMPPKYIVQMLVDWSAMSIKFGDTPKEYYTKNKDKIKLKCSSKICLEIYLKYI